MYCLLDAASVTARASGALRRRGRLATGPAPRPGGAAIALALALTMGGAWAGCATTGGAGAARRQGATVTFDDPRGDDHGPGTYAYPQGPPYRSGSLDLTSVRLSEAGGALDVQVTFARPIPVATVRLTADQVATLPVLAVDLYLDLDCVRGTGRREALPGRQARLADERGWEAAIVLHPTPGAVEGLYDRAARGVSVWLPRRVRVRGRSLRASVPLEVLEGHPLDRVGVAVAVSGVVFGASFRGAIDGAAPTAFVREVTAEPGQCGRWDEAPDGAPCTFGGCRGCGLHPRILDALAPRAGDQERALSRYDTERGLEGDLPVVGAPAVAAVSPREGDAAAGAPDSPKSTLKSGPTSGSAGSLEGEVRGREGAILTAWFPLAPPREGAVGRALDAKGGACGSVVVTERLSAKLVLARALGPLACQPASVRFPTSP